MFAQIRTSGTNQELCKSSHLGSMTKIMMMTTNIWQEFETLDCFFLSGATTQARCIATGEAIPGYLRRALEPPSQEFAGH